MDFGRAPQDVDLLDIDFDLPLGNDSVLPGKPNPNFKFYFGTSKWGSENWIGTLYPEGTRPANFLDEYLKIFNYIELNTVFYNIPTTDLIQPWANKISRYPQLKCTPKFSRQISHLKRFKNVQEETQQFIRSVNLFGNALGHSFIQTSDNFGARNFDALEEYLISIPDDFLLNVEFRNPTWFEPDTFRKVTDLLTDLDIGMVITDSAGRRDVVHTHLTSTCVHIRFNSYGNHPTDKIRMEAWRDKILSWKAKGIKEVYFCHDEQDTFQESFDSARNVFKELLV